MTGECTPHKASGQEPFLMQGTTVVSGSGKMLATAVGSRTEFGKFFPLIQAQDTETRVQEEAADVFTRFETVGMRKELKKVVRLIFDFLEKSQWD